MTNSLLPTEIGIDFDGVAWPLVEAVGSLPDCPSIAGKPLSYENCATWDTIIEIWGPEADFAFAAKKMDEARALPYLRRFGLYQGFAHALDVFRANGLQPTILSHNSDEAIGNVTAFLAEQGLSVPVVSAKPKEKIEWCLAKGAPLVDDAPGTIRDAHAAGLLVTAPRYLYNAEALDETQTPWGHDWSELLPLTLLAIGVKSPVFA